MIRIYYACRELLLTLLNVSVDLVPWCGRPLHAFFKNAFFNETYK